MIDYTNASISQLSVHHIGNKTNGDLLQLSKEEIKLTDKKLSDLLFRYFLSPFSSPDFYNFTFSNQDFKLNPLFTFATKLFEQGKDFHKISEHIAKHLFEVSHHPQIKVGDLFVVFFRNISLNGHVVNAIGLFKSENRQSFLKLEAGTTNFDLNYEEGINIEKLDKGCLIYSIDEEKGFKLSVLDKSNKGQEAHYWRDNFLLIRPCKDEYQQTKDFLSLAKTFVTASLPEDFEVNKTDQIDMLNRSMEYFKTHESFNRKCFKIRR
jgi:37-kD nucleoid-associated bacterial protein